MVLTERIYDYSTGRRTGSRNTASITTRHWTKFSVSAIYRSWSQPTPKQALYCAKDNVTRTNII